MAINSKNKVYQTVNVEMLNLYWNMGKKLCDFVFENLSNVSNSEDSIC